jgi:hypothetical protein
LPESWPEIAAERTNRKSEAEPVVARYFGSNKAQNPAQLVQISRIPKPPPIGMTGGG